jgi:21S rRNA (uridine2791-2'-O)-methyltransferase
MLTTPVPATSHPQHQDLCRAALSFASDTLKTGGNFVCKFYQGAEDKAFEDLLKKMFARVHREKPESSRSVSSFPFLSWILFPFHDNGWIWSCLLSMLTPGQESKEAFFVALRRKGDVSLEDIDQPEP